MNVYKLNKPIFDLIMELDQDRKNAEMINHMSNMVATEYLSNWFLQGYSLGCESLVVDIEKYIESLAFSMYYDQNIIAKMQWFIESKDYTERKLFKYMMDTNIEKLYPNLCFYKKDGVDVVSVYSKSQAITTWFEEKYFSEMTELENAKNILTNEDVFKYMMNFKLKNRPELRNVKIKSIMAQDNSFFYDYIEDEVECSLMSKEEVTNRKLYKAAKVALRSSAETKEKIEKQVASEFDNIFASVLEENVFDFIFNNSKIVID